MTWKNIEEIIGQGLIRSIKVYLVTYDDVDDDDDT
jgi:hypothetical protein